MNSLLFGIFAAAGIAAFAGYETVKLSSGPASMVGKVVAADVASTNASATVTFKRIRHIDAWTNGIEIVTTVWTNSTQYFDRSNGVWVATNIVHSASVTNRVRLLAADLWKTNEIVKVKCDNGFATSNIVNGAWFVPGDLIFADGKGADATVVIEK